MSQKGDLRDILLQNKGNGRIGVFLLVQLNLEKHQPKQLFEKYGKRQDYMFFSKVIRCIWWERLSIQYPNGQKVEYNVLMFECVIQSG
ncbi:hypothetical protein J2S17_005907 [Cytobacillus purgationiresistens]|uniref:Uncharacterized protein n=1 Tax=Cytobacillus purgationiresistens TaxID=863449 RepID=A0ABU0ARQ0_9BACI|nr:hypothetical protein [Cytobacillus purgationiresistens]